ncbi:nucleotide sugar dehydrogenase [Nocardia asteroides]|nr:nucleotide sugar dehydrogenase [Nocardia asteroides]
MTHAAHEKVTVVGIGYTGLPLAVALAHAGDHVWGVDVDRRRVAAVQHGDSPVDTVTAAEIRSVAGHLHPTTDPGVLADSAIVVVCVPTPVHETDNTPDLRPLISAVTTIRDHLRPGQLVVVESTVPPGTTVDLLRPILEESGLVAGIDFNLAYSPERIDPGNTRFRLTTTPRVVSGLTPACRDRAAMFYRRVVANIHTTVGIAEAETTKILENVFRQVNIALVNEFAQVCHELDIDIWDVIAAAATKPYGFMPFRPGAGVGGHCIPVDTLLMIHHTTTRLGRALRLAETAHAINADMPRWVADRIVKDLDDRGVTLPDATVLLLGVTYKPNVADTRGTPAIPLTEELLRRGLTVTYHDPYIPELRWAGQRLRRCDDLAAAVGSADLVVVVQRHRDYDAQTLASARRLFDATGPATDHHRGTAQG